MPVFNPLEWHKQRAWICNFEHKKSVRKAKSVHHQAEVSMCGVESASGGNSTIHHTVAM